MDFTKDAEREVTMMSITQAAVAFVQSELGLMGVGIVFGFLLAATVYGLLSNFLMRGDGNDV